MNVENIISKSRYPGSSQLAMELNAHEYFAVRLVELEGRLNVECPLFI